MALLDMQAWENWAAAHDEGEFDRQQSWVSFSLVDYNENEGPFGGGLWAPYSNDDWVRNDYGFALATVYIAFWFRWYDTSMSQRSMCLISEGSPGAATHHVDFRVDNFGGITVTRARNGTVLGSSDQQVFRCGLWHHVAIKCTVDDSAGVAVVRVDGNEVLNLTGLDTNNAGAIGQIDHFNFEGENAYNLRYSQPIAWSGSGAAPTDFFGLHRVHMLKPDGDTSTQFTTLGAGTNAAEVDEQECDDDTSYNESSTVTNKDKLTTESLPTEVTTIYAVKAMVMAKDPDGTATESIKIGLDSGTESLSAAQALSTGYEQFEGPIESVDPNTASAWTEANVNATDVVYEHA